ncbi:MAG: trypsin-like peptidase domain-containing protein [Deltaproteobacteria bacterium]|nr:trypsin-like peptidase domain-containing protein [Deltaproteobacteria bacterium]
MTTRRFENPSSLGARKLLIALGLLALLILLAFLFGTRQIPNGFSELLGNKLQLFTVKPRQVAPRGDLDASEQATIKLFQAASPSVVFVTTLAVRRDFLSLDVFQIPRGTGSGFVWDNNGFIVTNNHVIQNSDAARVTLVDGSSYSAKLVGVAPENDLAVLRIEASRQKIPPIAIGRSDNLLVGQTVYAIGNPFGLDQTLSKGVISGLGREIPTSQGGSITGLIQTDAAINPGNSGGPLLDSAGRLIGVNTAIFSPTGSYAGIGFAIPVDIVNRIVPQLIGHGRVIRPRIGIRIAEDSLMRRLGIEGVLILGVDPSSPAQQAGLRGTIQRSDGEIVLGDIIIEMDGKPVRNSGDLFRLLEGHDAGEAVTVQVLRGKSKLDLRVVLSPGS